MRWFARIVVAVLILSAAYVIWPLYGLKQLADAVEARDGATFSRLIRFRELKRSLIEQVVRAYLREARKTNKKLSPLALNLAVQVAMGLAEPVVADLLKTEALMNLLKKGGGHAFAGSRIVPSSWDWPNLNNVKVLKRATEYRGRNFFVVLPLKPNAQEHYRLRLKLTQWRWKLAGIELPEAMIDRLVRELLKKQPALNLPR